jgi:hypothetical protein
MPEPTENNYPKYLLGEARLAYWCGRFGGIVHMERRNLLTRSEAYNQFKETVKEMQQALELKVEE